MLWKFRVVLIYFDLTVKVFSPAVFGETNQPSSDKMLIEKYRVNLYFWVKYHLFVYLVNKEKVIIYELEIHHLL